MDSILIPAAINGQVNSGAGIKSTSALDQPANQPFLIANTIESSLEEIRHNHIIPVFIKDNETVISHVDFIELALETAAQVFQEETISRPSIRLSHPIKGRIPEAKEKAATDLLDHEKTLYFERMAFIIEIPTIYDDIQGQTISLTIGGVKAYNLDNLYNKKGADEHFKVFIGFQNKVCTNLCVWTDGYLDSLRVRSMGQLKGGIRTLLESYNASYHLLHLKKLQEFSLTEKQFANLIGRSKMYSHLPGDLKNEIPELLLTDTQVGVVVKDFYRDNSFCRDDNGNINLWRLYNLFTGANKSTYIDNFLDRSVNAFSFIENIRRALETRTHHWYLN